MRGERGRQNVIRTEGGVLRPSGAVDDTRLRCQSALCKWGDRPIGNWVIKRQRSSEDLHDEGQLRKRLDRLADDKDPSILLVHPSGQALSIDLKGTLAHVEFIPRAWRDPLLAASTLPTDKISKQAYVEFSIGGTPTEILRDLCVPVQTMIDIAVCFYRDNSLLQSINWVPLDWP